MKPGLNTFLKALFAFLILVNLPLIVFASLVLYAQFHGEMSGLLFFDALSKEQIGALEGFFGIDFELPERVAACLIVAYVANLLAYLSSFLPGFMRRPFWRLMLLHGQIGIPLACVVGAYLPPKIASFEEISDTIPLLAMSGVFLPYPFLAWQIERFVGATLVRMTRSLVRREHYGMANRVLALAVRFQPANRELRRTMGLNCYREGQILGAIEMLEPLLAEAQEDAELIDTLEKSYRIESMWERALEMERLQLGLDPEQIATRIRAGRILKQLGRLEEAIELLREGLPSRNMELLELLLGLSIDADHVEEAVDLARQIESLDQGTQERSIGWYRKIVAQAPANVKALEELATLLVRHRHEEEGFSFYEQVVQGDPQRHDLRTRLVRYYQEMNEIPKAEPHLAALMDAGRDTVDVALLYGDILLRREDYDRALPHFQCAVERYPDDYRFAYFLGRIHLGAGALEEAERCAERALPCAESRKDRRRVQALQRRIEQGQLERELEDWQRRCEREPEAVEPHLGLIGAMSRLGQSDRALAECDALLEMHPGRESEILTELEAFAEKSEKNFRLLGCVADLNLKREEWDKALEFADKMAKRSLDGSRLLIEHCQRILRHAPEHVASLRRLAEVRSERGEWTEARAESERLLEIDKPRQLDHLHRIFRANEELGDEDKALEAGEGIVARDSADMGMRLRLIRIYGARRHFEKAYGHIEGARAIDFYNAELGRLKDELDLNYRDYRLEELLATLKENPSDTAMQLEAGDLLMEADDLKKAIACYQRAARNPELKDLARAKQALAMSYLRMFDLVEETADQITLARDDSEESDKTTALVYEIAEILEGEAEFPRALHLYKKIFRVNADFREVVERIESLSEGL